MNATRYSSGFCKTITVFETVLKHLYWVKMANFDHGFGWSKSFTLAYHLAYWNGNQCYFGANMQVHLQITSEHTTYSAHLRFEKTPSILTGRPSQQNKCYTPYLQVLLWLADKQLGELLFDVSFKVHSLLFSPPKAPDWSFYLLTKVLSGHFRATNRPTNLSSTCFPRMLVVVVHTKVAVFWQVQKVIVYLAFQNQSLVAGTGQQRMHTHPQIPHCFGNYFQTLQPFTLTGTSAMACCLSFASSGSKTSSNLRANPAN